MAYKVTVGGGNLRFGAAHFITMGGKCERLHGHNYGVSAVVEAALGADSYVIDFGELKRVLRDTCEQLDHRFLLPLHNPQMSISQDAGHWQLLYEERRYVFPESDVLPLPLDNVTAERLAEHIWGVVCRELRGKLGDRSVTIGIGVEEAPGQTAWFTQEL